MKSKSTIKVKAKKVNNQSVIRTKYSPQFKDQTLERVAKDGVAKVAKDLGLSESLIYSWKARKNQCGDSLENQKLQEGELARLRRELHQLAQENAFLKKAAAYFAKDQK